MGVSENGEKTPFYPMVLLIIIPMKNGYFIGNMNPTFSVTNPNTSQNGRMETLLSRSLSLARRSAPQEFTMTGFQKAAATNGTPSSSASYDEQP